MMPHQSFQSAPTRQKKDMAARGNKNEVTTNNRPPCSPSCSRCSWPCSWGGRPCPGRPWRCQSTPGRRRGLSACSWHSCSAGHRGGAGKALCRTACLLKKENWLHIYIYIWFFYRNKTTFVRCCTYIYWQKLHAGYVADSNELTFVQHWPFFLFIGRGLAMRWSQCPEKYPKSIKTRFIAH